MASSYPGALDTTAKFPQTIVDGTDAGDDTPGSTNVGFLSQWMRDAGDAIVKMQTEDGINPSASFVDVATRLNSSITVRKTADQTNTTTTPANVTDLTFPVVAGQDYGFEFFIPFSSSLATAGIGLSVTVPALTGFVNYIVRIPRLNDTAGAAPATPPEQVGHGTASNDEVVSDAVGTINVLYMAKIEGVLSNPSASGSIQVRFRAEVAATITIKKGAFGRLVTG